MRSQPRFRWIFRMNRVTRSQFARLCGVNRSTVTRWLQNGRIVADHAGMIDPEAAARMRIATESPMPQHQARKAQFDEARAAGRSGGPSVDLDDGDADAEQILLGAELKRATVDLQRAKAELALLEVDRVAGTLVELAEVQFVLADTGTLVRAELEAMPDRLASELIAFASDRAAMHAALERWAFDALTRIADQLDERGERLAQG